MSLKKEDLKYLINTCLSLELYDEAYDYSQKLKKICNNIFDEEERNLYMKCLKGKLNIERNAWKILIDFENYEQDKEIIPKKIMKEKKDFLESERKKLCFEVINDCKNFEKNIDEDDYSAKIFYLKLKADYMRYYGETASEDEFEKYKDLCRETYEKAFQLCKEYLEPTDLLYLSVTLNYSVFLYTLTDETSNAYNIANETYKQAIVKKKKKKKDPEVEGILKSIEENITIWRIEISEYNN